MTPSFLMETEVLVLNTLLFCMRYPELPNILSVFLLYLLPVKFVSLIGRVSVFSGSSTLYEPRLNI